MIDSSAVNGMSYMKSQTAFSVVGEGHLKGNCPSLGRAVNKYGSNVAF